MKIVEISGSGFKKTLKNVIQRRNRVESQVENKVKAILRDVRGKGDKAIFTGRFDRFDLSNKKIRVTRKEIEEPASQIDKETADSFNLAALSRVSAGRSNF